MSRKETVLSVLSFVTLLGPWYELSSILFYFFVPLRCLCLCAATIACKLCSRSTLATLFWFYFLVLPFGLYSFNDEHVSLWFSCNVVVLFVQSRRYDTRTTTFSPAGMLPPTITVSFPRQFRVEPKQSSCRQENEKTQTNTFQFHKCQMSLSSVVTNNLSSRVVQVDCSKSNMPWKQSAMEQPVSECWLKMA